jgi:APA family basic amino acid/polyamine antiporter
MADDGLFIRWAARVHPRFRTPYRAIVLQGIWASVLVATGSYQVLVARVVYTEWIFFALMALGLIVLRRRSSYEPTYRVPGFPILPIAFAVVSLLIVANQLLARPIEALTGLLLVLVGWPVYHLWLRRAPLPSRALSHGD